MNEIITSRFIIKLIGYDLNIDIPCPKSCWRVRDGEVKECTYLKEYDIGNPIYKMNIIRIVVKNISEKPLTISNDKFKIVDDMGFLHSAKIICSDIFVDSRFSSGSIEILPNTQVKYRLATEELEDDAKLKSIQFMDKEYYNLEVSEGDYTILTSEEEIKVDNARLLDELGRIQETAKASNNSNDNIVKYSIEEDDDCLYIISKEKDKTISFHRRFNFKASNYNWVDKGDPLISIYFDDSTQAYLNTQLISQATGVFEYDKKQFIKYNEQICRIRKYLPQDKESIFLELEKKAIKDAVFKRERKKIIEREALDELINEGLVFNSYIDKNGNRNKIPNDVANAVWNRDGGKCCECGSKESLEFDHIIPVSKGGASTYQNLQILCKSCNIRKSNKIG